MAKKSLKSTLSSQQARLKKNAKVKEAAQVRDKSSNTKSTAKGKAKAPPPRHSTIPFQATDKILLIGEGNFSFALALFIHPSLQYLPSANVIATSYDKEEECYDKYPGARNIVDKLKGRGVEVLFGVDATKLESCKALKGRRFNRVVWNFPHAGKGITDQDRNILTNQVLLLGFLRSVKPFLSQGSVPRVATSRNKAKKGDGSESEGEQDALDELVMTEDEDITRKPLLNNEGDKSRGTVLVTLRNVPPYTEWDLPKLAKKPPPPPPSSSSLPNPKYIQLRSFTFRRSDWPGYEHRMTKGERAHGTGTTGVGGEDRTWEFCLKDE